jgi:hypothetical protein
LGGDRSGEDGSGGDRSGKNRSVGDGSVRNGLVAKKVAADPPFFNWLSSFLSICFEKRDFTRYSQIVVDRFFSQKCDA